SELERRPREQRQLNGAETEMAEPAGVVEPVRHRLVRPLLGAEGEKHERCSCQVRVHGLRIHERTRALGGLRRVQLRALDVLAGEAEETAHRVYGGRPVETTPR